MGLLSSLASLGASTALDLVKSRASPPRVTRESAVPGEHYDQRIEFGRGPGKAVVSDPHIWVFAGGNYVEKPNSMGYSVLRYLAMRDPILAAIILTRLRQVRSFAQIRTHDETERSIGRGFRIRMKSGNAKSRSNAVTKREDELNNIFLHCARPDVPAEERQERHFGTFIWRFVNDRLQIDQACAEIQLDKSGKLYQFFAIDGATIRRVDKASREYTKGPYVQIYQQRVVAQFADEELAFCPENLSTMLSRVGYGMAEPEFALRSVMTHLGIEASNERMFHPGSMPKGLLVTKNADISEANLRVLEQKWRAQVANMRGRHNIPVIGMPRGGEMNFIHFPQPTDIEHGKFLDYLVNLLAALYGMDPLEINFPNRGGMGGGKSLFSNENEEARLTHAQDKGLKPLLSWFETCMNLEILPALDPEGEFEFVFVGFDTATDQERIDLAQKQAKFLKMVDEVRAENGLDPLPEGQGQVILDPTWMQAKQAADTAAQQAQQADQGQGTDQGQGQPIQGQASPTDMPQGDDAADFAAGTDPGQGW